jgi:hypothetical protein
VLLMRVAYPGNAKNTRSRTIVLKAVVRYGPLFLEKLDHYITKNVTWIFRRHFSSVIL